MLASLLLLLAQAPVSAVERVGVTVADLDVALRFYTEVLDFEKLAEEELAGEEFERATGVFGARARRARLRLGREEFELTDYLAPASQPLPADSRSHDRWFQHIAIIVSDMDAAYARLRRHKAEHISSGPQLLPAWNRNAGGIAAFYFRDPDGHALEVLQFPPDKGEPRWQAKDRLFLGIDHTAIAVADTEASLRFYRDALGLRVAGAGENYGPEQERLNAVFGARLRITALRAARGPGIELLEYLSPRDGRPYPPAARPSDLVHWQTTLAAAPLEGLLAPVRAGGGSALTAGVAAGSWLARDPDGHALQFVAPQQP